MRGKAKHTYAFQFRHRITPACAGKRLCLTCVLAILWDHPRMCGEKWLARFKPFATRGSPPHVRGKEEYLQETESIDRITPACAGKRIQIPPPDNAPWDHPRMCGEKLPASTSRTKTAGSPPHVRGKASRTRFNRDQTRITPACAGKSRDRPETFHDVRDHPRMCGEKGRRAGRK